MAMIDNVRDEFMYPRGYAVTEGTHSPPIDVSNKQKHLDDVTRPLQVPFIELSAGPATVALGARVRCRANRLGKRKRQSTFHSEKGNAKDCTYGVTQVRSVDPPVDMRSDGTLRPYQAKDRHADTQRMHLAHCGRGGHPVLPVGIVQEMIQRLLILPKRTREFEARRLGQLETWRALIA